MSATLQAVHVEPWECAGVLLYTVEAWDDDDPCGMPVVSREAPTIARAIAQAMTYRPARVLITATAPYGMHP